MDAQLKLMLLLNASGLGAQGYAKFSTVCSEPWELWNPDVIDAASSVLSQKQLGKLRRLESEGWAEREEERAEKLGVKFLTLTDENYPRELEQLHEPPVVLYIKGDLTGFSGHRTGIVGTRRAGRYGREAAARIGGACARHGSAVISGGAAGVDGIAQTACCEAGGRSFAVLGTGVDQIYPASNAELFKILPEKGALISEYPLGTKGEPWRFPHRNRIVAALSQKLIVVEAPVKSGSMITARLALELGVEVWALPGQIYDENAQGTNQLIYDGAFPYINDSVYFSSCGLTPTDEEKTTETASSARKLTDNEQLILKYLYENGEKTIDNLATAVKISAAELMPVIMLLKAEGLIFMSSPGRYCTTNSL